MKILKNFIIVIVLIIFASSIYLMTNLNMFTTNLTESENTKLTAYSDKYNKYINNPYGYEIVLLNDLTLNEDIVSVKSRFESKKVVVDVLYDNFQNTLDSNRTYNIYGNEGIKKNSDFKVTDEYDQLFYKQNGHVLLFERKKIFNDDRNYYATIAFERSTTEIVTVFIKSSYPIKIDEIMLSFKFVRKNGEIKNDKVFDKVNKNFDTLTVEFYNTYFLNNEKLNFGIYEPTFPNYDEKLNELEKIYDYDFPVTLLYNSFMLPFKTDIMNNAKQEGKVVEYTLYTTDMINGIEKDITLQILEGQYDEYLDNLSKSFNDYDYPLLFRLNNEMNGGWVLYSSYFVGKDTDLYIECWRYIYNKFRENKVDNLIFVWNPNERSFPNFAYNNYLNYYPGDEYVDVVGLTAYNTGNYYQGEIWRSFSEAYDHFYYDYLKHFNHPFMITEFSCASAGGNKAEWFDNMFNIISDYDRIKIAVLWNGQDFDMSKKEKTISRNYRLDLDKDIIQSLKNGLQKYK